MSSLIICCVKVAFGIIEDKVIVQNFFSLYPSVFSPSPYIHTCALRLKIIVTDNGIGTQSSKPGRACLCFSSI